MALTGIKTLTGFGGGGGGGNGDHDSVFSVKTNRVAVDTQTDSSASAWAMTDTSIARTFTIGTIDEVLDRVLSFVDESLGASTNNITIDTQSASLIDGQSSIIISVDGGGFLLKFDGTNWKAQP